MGTGNITLWTILYVEPWTWRQNWNQAHIFEELIIYKGNMAIKL